MEYQNIVPNANSSAINEIKEKIRDAFKNC